MTKSSHDRPPPARVITVRQPYAWAIVTGRKTTENRTWKTYWRGRLWIHAGTGTDEDAPAELWPAEGELLLSSAILGHVTLTGVEGEPGAWRWVLADPLQLAEPIRRVRGYPGIWLYDLPPALR